MDIGVDTSTYTGLAALSDTDLKTRLLHFDAKKDWERVKSIAVGVHSFLDEVGEIGEIVIEGYAFGNQFTIVKLVEIGTIVRECFHSRSLSWYSVPPSVLKRWTTGRGNCQKREMKLAVKERWGFVSPSGSDDVVDAFALAQMAREIRLHGLSAQMKGVRKCG